MSWIDWDCHWTCQKRMMFVGHFGCRYHRDYCYCLRLDFDFGWNDPDPVWTVAVVDSRVVTVQTHPYDLLSDMLNSHGWNSANWSKRRFLLNSDTSLIEKYIQTHLSFIGNSRFVGKLYFSSFQNRVLFKYCRLWLIVSERLFAIQTLIKDDTNTPHINFWRDFWWILTNYKTFGR